MSEQFFSDPEICRPDFEKADASMTPHVDGDKIARETPELQPQWTVRRGIALAR